MEVGLVRGAVAEEGDRDRAVLAQLRGERRAGRGRDRAADDAEAADQPVLERDDVHRAAPAAVGAGLAPEELGEQRRLVDAERERRAVTAVRRGHGVARLEHVADADRDRLLALVEVRRALDLVVEEEPVDGILEQPDAQHPLVERLELREPVLSAACSIDMETPELSGKGGVATKAVRT